MRSSYTPNFRDGFRNLEPKSRDLLPQNVVQTNILQSQTADKFHETRPIRSQGMVKLRSQYSLKWPSQNKRTGHANVVRSN